MGLKNDGQEPYMVEKDLRTHDFYFLETRQLTFARKKKKRQLKVRSDWKAQEEKKE